MPTTAPQASTATILRAAGVRKSFVMGDTRIEVLKGCDLTIRPGEFIAIEGRSGSGKSTLLHIMGALDEADDGTIEYAGRDLARESSSARAGIRNCEFGFVFQFYHLLPELSVLENTMLAAMIENSWFSFRSRRAELRDAASAILKSLGLEHRLKHRPAQLSGGERQRVAIARALMNKPKVLFADEPTGNLDADTGRQIMAVLEKLHRDAGQTIIMVTHDRALARTADRVLVLKDGILKNADRTPSTTG
ncbi:MAG TPA: ABC transporter ATP-binding protein [Tepidisphaeraceae bacterium]|nr:ABC transporter ATP-binding protein [Tepidisphaeraceae bacterium]